MQTRACLALCEETEAERQRLYQLLPRLSPEAIATGNVETEDNVRGILCHVTFAIFSYACWMERVVGRLDPEREKEAKQAFLGEVRSQTSAEGFEAASRAASEHYYRVASDLSADELDREFRTNWGATMPLELMLEHALAHLMRHRRQIEIHLGLRPAGRTR